MFHRFVSFDQNQKFQDGTGAVLVIDSKAINQTKKWGTKNVLNSNNMLI